MDILLLDVVDVVPAKTAGYLDRSFYLTLALTIAVEALLMRWMQYQSWGKSLLHALVINLVSVVAGFLFYELMPGLFDPQVLLKFLCLFGLTVLAEAPVLQLLNRSKPWRKTWLTALVINAVTYLLFFIFLQIITG